MFYSSTDTKIKPASKPKTQKTTPWNVVIFDDPVNLMQYVTMVLKKVFGYSTAKANKLMLEIHEQGRSIVWSGNKEKAEFYVQLLHGWQLQASIEKTS